MVPAAMPLLTATGPPRLVVPSLNCTAPTTVAGVTVAVSVSRVPGVTGEAGEVVSTVLVAVEFRKGAAELLGWNGLPSVSAGAALASPPESDNAPRTVIATKKGATA